MVIRRDVEFNEKDYRIIRKMMVRNMVSYQFLMKRKKEIKIIKNI
jgi:hypothetical protein